jgi:hypothetical protein
MIRHLRHVFESLRREHGEWSLFAVLQRPRRAVSHWDIVVAAPWLPYNTKLDDLKMIFAKLDEVTTPLERLDLGIVLILRERSDIAGAAESLLDGRSIDHPVGLVLRKNFDFRGQRLRRGYIWAANPALIAPPAVPAA